MIRKAPLPSTKKVQFASPYRSSRRSVAYQSPMQSSGPCMVTSYLDPATERSTQGFDPSSFRSAYCAFASTPQYARFVERTLPSATDDAFIATWSYSLAGGGLLCSNRDVQLESDQQPSAVEADLVAQPKIREPVL